MRFGDVFEYYSIAAETALAMLKKLKLRRLIKWLTPSRFEVEARAQAAVLPVLTRQLQETVGSIETSTEEVCASFAQMANLARDAANGGTALLDESDEPSVNDTIRDCRALLVHLSDRMEHSGTLYSRAINQMEIAGESVQAVFKVLQQLDQASFVSRIVALNAKIESVHLGQLGTGFEVVAEQISSQAALSAELTASVVAVLTDLTRTMNGATGELKELAEADKNEAERSRQEASQTLMKLEQASRRMQHTVSETRQTSETLYEQISRAIVNLQFQDRVSQRLGHVIDSLNSMSRTLSNLEHTDQDSEALARRKRQIAEELAATYTMPSERVVHEHPSAAAGATADADAGGTIELF